MTLRHLSLFSGIGGIDLGFERAGMTTVGQVERDPHNRAILARHFAAPIHDDVTTFLDWWTDDFGPVDVVSAGFPCQPFSTAGKQLGTDDERWLWPATARAVRHVRPRYVFLENVSRLVADGGAWGTVLGDLHRLGFDAEWTTRYASDFGAPTPRRRVYLLAYPARQLRNSRRHLGAGRVGRSPLAARGLVGLPSPEVRRRAGAWLASEPDVGRMVDGLSAGVDRAARIYGLGNSVVPPIAEHFGRMIVGDSESGDLS